MFVFGLPKAWKPTQCLLLRTRRAGALSVKSNVLNATASGVLFVYALLRGDLIFIAVMGFQLVAAVLIVVLNILYRGDAT